MNYIRGATVIVSAAFLSLALSSAKGDPNTVMLDTAPYYPGLGGGEFTAYTSQNFTGNYATTATYNQGFETFCLETGVEFSPGVAYYYTLGNVTQPNPGVAQDGSGLPLSQGAAYLYYQFGEGLLNGYDYTGSGRAADDNLLQAAIWAFQGGQSYGGYPTPITDNIFYNEAIAALGGLAAADSDYTGSNVQVLQVWSNPDYTGAAQNQLVITSVPDGGLTVALLGGALIGLQVLRRKSLV